MRNVIRTERFGDFELSLIEISRPSEDGAIAFDYNIRVCLASGGTTRPIGDLSEGFADRDSAWAAGLKHVAVLRDNATG